LRHSEIGVPFNHGERGVFKMEFQPLFAFPQRFFDGPKIIAGRVLGKNTDHKNSLSLMVWNCS
jgi:hypothetical protein